MATKLAPGGGPLAMNITGHAAGIFADMTVDGPEIGTLVLIVDRAKNLPNRKTMGKQNPYCAARLGKEAKKTETDKRGGQTPKWDQELRFTVHDSPDYHNLKISVFSEDKRTDLIGEAWVGLDDVLVPGGGKSDVWQGLNCKGKYAGEIRLELTYYDGRPKPETEEVVAAQEKSSKVKRRPLPTDLSQRGLTPETIPEATAPGRARHGPREYRSQSKAAPHQEPARSSAPLPHPVYGDQLAAPSYPHTVSAPVHLEQHSQGRYTHSTEHTQEYSQTTDEYGPGALDFLPQLPPSSRQRAIMQSAYPSHPDTAYAPHARQHFQPESSYVTDQYHPQHPPPLSHSHSAPIEQEQQYSEHPRVHASRVEPPTSLQHSYSAPTVHPAEDIHLQYDQYNHMPEEEPGTVTNAGYRYEQSQYMGRDMSLGHDSYGEGHHYRQPYVEDEDSPPPPPPPVHSSSAPAVPQYDPNVNRSPSSQTPTHDNSPPSTRQMYVAHHSPLQDIERRFAPSQNTTPYRHPARGQSMDTYGSSPSYSSPHTTPPSLTPGQRPSPASRPSPPTQSQRHIAAEPYFATPSRPHPLSQEVPRGRSPQPPREPRYAEQTPPNREASDHEYRGRDPVPLVKPRAISPSPGPGAQQARSIYDIQFPIRGFESSEVNPLSTANRQTVTAKVVSRSTPVRKSVSPRPTPPGSEPRTSVPFSPDSYDVHNPTSRTGGMPANASPHSPYQIKAGTNQNYQDQHSGPITGWDGREIDPSDHLPVDSWAPEPEKKTPAKTYGLGRERDFGPRSREMHVSGGINSTTGAHRLSKDTVVNFRNRTAPEPEATPSRNRLQKKGGGTKDRPLEPLRERHNFNDSAVPNPYEQHGYSRRFHNGTADNRVANNYEGGPYVLQHERGYSLPAIPPKVPMQQQARERHYANGSCVDDCGPDALSREISSIDLDAGGRQRSRHGNYTLYTTSPVAATDAEMGSGSAGQNSALYVPVRSHRDRNTVYY